MSNSFSTTINIGLQDFSLGDVAHSLSPLNRIEIYGMSNSIGNLIKFEIESVELSFGPTSYIDAIDFLLGGGQLVMAGEIIHRSDTSELQVSNLTITDKTGTGPAILSAPSGSAYQFRGARVSIENNIDSYSIPQHKSGYVWTNTGAVAATTGVLPSGALEGTSAYFIRTGPEVYIDPGVSAQIYIPESGFFRSAGQMAHLASSGARIGVVCDGANNWYPLIELGIID